jgi:hypothetical protein
MPVTISKTITRLPYLRPFKNLTLIMPKAWDDYLEKNKDRFLNEMLDLLRIPSVSAKGEHKADMQKCAELVKQRLLDAGCDKAEVIETDGHPVVYGEKIIDPAMPTVLIYGHYDVQPAEPLELWHSGPFEPVIKDGKVFARGSADDKGQFYMHSQSAGNDGANKNNEYQHKIFDRRRRRNRLTKPWKICRRK